MNLDHFLFLSIDLWGIVVLILVIGLVFSATFYVGSSIS
jgi:hypothetical protein